MTSPVHAKSANATTPALEGENTATPKSGDGVLGTSAGGTGVHGVSVSAFGVLGESKTGRGVVAISDSDYALRAASRAMPGVRASSEEGTAIEGWSKGAQTGVIGLNNADGTGLAGRSTSGIGTRGDVNSGVGVLGAAGTGTGVEGVCSDGDGVVGQGRRGVVGRSPTFQGVYGWSGENAGVVGESDQLSGVWAISHHRTNAGLFATNDNGGPAAFFKGDLLVTGVINLLGGDIAENFDVEDDNEIALGSVVVVRESGRVGVTTTDHDTAVVGVVAGAPGFRPALLLDSESTGRPRLGVTLIGKVMCLVDAGYAPIRAGDFLTTSNTAGHAMRISEPERSFGAILGKALAPLATGRALVPVLAMLR